MSNSDLWDTFGPGVIILGPEAIQNDHCSWSAALMQHYHQYNKSLCCYFGVSVRAGRSLQHIIENFSSLLFLFLIDHLPILAHEEYECIFIDILLMNINRIATVFYYVFIVTY